MSHEGGAGADPAYWRGKRVLVTGGAGFVGSHVVRRLIATRGLNVADIRVPRSADCDLRVRTNAERAVEGCDIVLHLAAVTGGIGFSRQHPASQYYDSTLMDLHIVDAARRAGVEKLVGIGNLFAYAPEARIPLDEADLFSGLPGESHRGVGWLKRNLAVTADLYHREHELPMVVVYSANAYGPGDSLDPVHSHVIPSTIMKCLREPELVVWGDGTPTRDFLYVEDVAEGLLLAAERLAPPTYVNIGSGVEVSIRELVELAVRLTGFRGSVTFDETKFGGDARRAAGVARARERLGYAPGVSFEEGMQRTVGWYRSKLLS